MARARDIQEIINYRKCIDFIDNESQKKDDSISEELIFKLHSTIVYRILSEDQSGKLRDKQVVIRNSENGEITFRPPTSIEVPYLLKEYVYWVNNTKKDDMHPVIKAGIAHHELVRIHPFLDGNGRVARIIATLIMLRGGYDIRRFFSLEEYYDRDAISYYENLQKATTGDMTSWLEYFTFGASTEFEKIKDQIMRLSKDAKLKEKFGGQQIFLTDRQIKLLEAIIREYSESSEPVGSKTVVAKYSIKASPATIRNEMAALLEDGFLEMMHTSSGRIPTSRAFRYFVERLMHEDELPVLQEVAVKQRLWPQRFEFEKLLRNAEANAHFQGLNVDELIIKTIVCNRASAPSRYGRIPGRSSKRTSVWLVLSAKEKMDSKNDQKKQ